MRGVRQMLLLFGMLSLVGGASQLAAGPGGEPWAWLDHHVRQALAMGNGALVVRVDLGRSYAMLARAVRTDGPS